MMLILTKWPGQTVTYTSACQVTYGMQKFDPSCPPFKVTQRSVELTGSHKWPLDPCQFR